MVHRVWAVARSLIVMIACALVLGVAPASGKARWLGFNDNSSLSHQLTPEEDGALLARAGANSVRIGVEWNAVERSPGNFDFSRLDAIYDELLRRGIRPLLSVMGSPPWAQPPLSFCPRMETCRFAPDRSKDQAWGHFVAEVARRFPRAVAIEIWNEPNLRVFFAPAPDPVRYTELLRIGHDAVKSVAPGMPVLGGALAPVLDGTVNGDLYALRPFLRAMYANGARGLMDGLSIHPYPHDRPVGRVYEAINAALETRDDAGDRVPLWLTEVGASTSEGYSEAGQAALLGDLVRRLRRRPEVRGVYLHTLIDPSAPSSGHEDGYGIVRRSGERKPAFCSVARALRRNTRCAGAPPDPAAVARWHAQESLQMASEVALVQRRLTGSYTGLTSAGLHQVRPGLSADPPQVDNPPGVTADPRRIAMLAVPGQSDAVRLCNASRETHSYCVTIVHGGPWRYTAVAGTIAAADAATDAGTAQVW